MKYSFTANSEEVNTTCQAEWYELKYVDESKYNFNTGGYENL